MHVPATQTIGKEVVDGAVGGGEDVDPGK